MSLVEKLLKERRNRKEKVMVKLKKEAVPIAEASISATTERPEQYNRVVETEYGKLVFNTNIENLRENILFIYPKKKHALWKNLAPLFLHKGVQEIFIRGEQIYATVEDIRYKVILYGEFNPIKFIETLAIKTGVSFSEQHPDAETNRNGWRLHFKKPSIALGKMELSATRVVKVPLLPRLTDPIIAARLAVMALKPSVVVVVGPLGSGKTTLLNSLLEFITLSYPLLKVSIVEWVPEINVSSGIVSRAVCRSSLGRDMTYLIRQEMRYGRTDILVVGELRSEEIFSWIEAGREGIPCLATCHSPSFRKAIWSLAKLMRQRIQDANPRDVIDVINVFIVCRKWFEKAKIRRGLSEVYFVRDYKLYPIYVDGTHLRDILFRELFDEYTYVGGFEDVYRNFLGETNFNDFSFRDFEPIHVDELFE